MFWLRILPVPDFDSVECIELWIKPSVLADRHGSRGLLEDIVALVPQSCQHQQQTSERGEFATVTQGLYDVFVTLISTPSLAQIHKILQALPERQYPQDTPNRAQWQSNRGKSGFESRSSGSAG